MGSCCVNRELQCRQQAQGLWEFQLGTDPNLGVGDIKDTLLKEGGIHSDSWGKMKSGKRVGVKRGVGPAGSYT